ncbi:hypothetical protein SLE2022_126150 [Rubroshorea leprosula]
MGGNDESSKQVIESLTGMGFENSDIMEAVKAVGPSLDAAVEYILNGCCRNSKEASTSSKSCVSNRKSQGKRDSISRCIGQTRQSSILDHFQSNRGRVSGITNASASRSEVVPGPLEVDQGLLPAATCNPETLPETLPVCCLNELDIGSDWEEKVNNLLKKFFGYSSLKSFQKEALAAWLAHQDCLVLAATGSGKSLCFQIPALLTGKVVVVVSPLISLMHDQCLKLSKHGVASCFLGSGQSDSSVEQKAMRGMYSIIYVCPETILRLVEPLQKLAKSRGIALFAIDEVHCVSKWGHDFRPDYRRLSVLRGNFIDIPLMALTATATVQVREDIINSLHMSKETKIVLTSFFRPNLRFLVKHSRTSSSSSYEKDFSQLIGMYARKKNIGGKKQTVISQEFDDQSDSDHSFLSGLDDFEAGGIGEDDEIYSTKGNASTVSKEKEMSIEYLENDVDVFRSVDDWDVACGEFCAKALCEDRDANEMVETIDQPNELEKGLRLLGEPLEKGPTIIYVPTRKETLSIAKYLCDFGVRAAAYNASLPKSHLRKVHKEFHENSLEVVVATIAFGMGIDKSNVRRIIHYGWPQSLEAYYQEAGRAGRDGKLADCILYANLSRVPTLLPSRRSEEQKKQAYKMLSDCFRYGMNTSGCRAKTLVEYFGEQFGYEKCLLCDVCVDGPPDMQDLREEANTLMQIIAAHYDGLYDDFICSDTERQKLMAKPNLRMFVSKIREQSQKFLATDLLWWQGLARIMESKGYIRERCDEIYVQIKFPEPTRKGLDFVQYERDQAFYVYPEADMLLSLRKTRSFSTFSQWGKGWADPEIRRQRLENIRASRQPRHSRKRKRKSRKFSMDLKTARGRIMAKVLKKK